MLTDFEGVARKNEVGFCIWTSKEVCQSFSHPQFFSSSISRLHLSLKFTVFLF
ncbi:unnamed protein product, partial [Prunus brigantina]